MAAMKRSRTFLLSLWMVVFISLLQFDNDYMRPFFSQSRDISAVDQIGYHSPTSGVPFVLLAEPRCYAATPLVLTNVLERVPESFKVVLLHSSFNQHCVSHWLNETGILREALNRGQLILRKDERSLESASDGDDTFDMNGWITTRYINSTWWRQLRSYGNAVLTMQSDSIICSKNYTTAPWHDANFLGGISNRQKRVSVSNETNQYQLSGDFSIRNIEWMIACLESHDRVHLNEDLIFNSCKGGSATVSVVDAMRFASNAGHTMCFDWQGERVCPYGVSKPWVLEQRHKESYQELVRYCPEITKLRELQHTDPFVLITEPRCHAATPFVVSNALATLPGTFKVVWFYSTHNLHCVNEWMLESDAMREAVDSGRLVMRMDERMDPNIEHLKYKADSWNTLLLVNKTWWEELRQYGNTVLTMQSDTIICSKNHSTVPWHGVNLLGGVSHTQNRVPASEDPNPYHLNGGFSLRSVDWILSCLEQTSENKLAEDGLFNACPNGKTQVKVVDAMKFSSDSGHSLCFDWDGQRICPYGVHKPWMVGKNFPEQYEELERYCPDIKILRERQRVMPFALLVEPRCYAATPFVLRNALKMLPKIFKVVFVYSNQHNEACVRRWIHDGSTLQKAVDEGRLVLRTMEELGRTNSSDAVPNDNPDNNGHNVPLADASFWEGLRQYGTTVLTLQSDSIICSKNHTQVDWHDVVDILGGISDTNVTSNSTITPHTIDRTAMSGAFSLRRVHWVINCLDQNSAGVLPDDMLLKNCSTTPVAVRSSASLVSELGRTMCFDSDGRRVCPYGVRRPWALGEQYPEQYQELVNYCPDIQPLHQLQTLEVAY